MNPARPAFWTRLGTQFLPFADAATPDLPLGRLMRLSLFQVSVGIAATLLTGTLNRVMIVELNMSASLVAAMVSLPLVFAPLRALIGFKSDNHRSLLGWKRVPYLWFGTLMQFGGLAITPFALLILSGDTMGPRWIGTADIAAELRVGVASPTPIPMSRKPGISAGQDASPCTSRPPTSPPAPMISRPPPMIGPELLPWRNRPIAAETANAARESGSPVRPAWMGLRPRTDCSQIEV